MPGVLRSTIIHFTATFVLVGTMRNPRFMFFAAAIASSIVLVIFAIFVFPIPGTDSFVFLPPALSYARGEGFTNAIYYVDQFTDPTHTHRFNYYVPFFPWLLGLVAKVAPDVRTMFVFCALLSAGALLLCARIFSRHAAGLQPIARWAALALFFYLPIYLLPTVARPENITVVFALLAYLVYQVRDRFSPLVFGLLISGIFGLMLASQILAFFFAFLVFALCELLREAQPLRRLPGIAAIGFASVAIACALIAVGPIGLPETIRGIGLHLDFVNLRHDNSIRQVFYFWMLAPLSFGFGGLFLLAVFLFARQMRDKLVAASPAKHTLVWTLVAVLLFGLVKFVLYAAPTVYNVTQFVLPISVYIIVRLANDRSILSRKVSGVALLVVGMAGAVLMFRNVALFAGVQASGKTFAASRKEAMQLIGGNSSVIVSNGLWSVFPWGSSPTVRITDKIKSGDTVLLQQAYLKYLPPFAEKSDVLREWSTDGVPSIFGVKLASTAQGYGFVMYKMR